MSEGAIPVPATPGPGAARRRGLRILVTVVVVGAVALGFGLALRQNWEAVVAADLRPEPEHAVAVLLFAAAVALSGLLWGSLLNTLSAGVGERVGARQAIAVHCLSWLLKYVPGQVGSLVSKIVWGRRHGHPRSLVAITFVYENVFLQLASILPAIVVLAVAAGPALVEGDPTSALLSVLVLLPLAVVLVPRWFHALVNVPGRRLLKRDVPEEWVLRPLASLRYLAAFVAPRVVNGVGFVLLATTVVDLPAGSWVPLGASYALAGAIGILAVLVPSGLGVREAVLFACLVALGVEPGPAVVVSVLARLLSTLADAVVALLYAGLRLTTRKAPTA